jgi:hypothetical protein
MLAKQSASAGLMRFLAVAVLVLVSYTNPRRRQASQQQEGAHPTRRRADDEYPRLRGGLLECTVQSPSAGGEERRYPKGWSMVLVITLVSSWGREPGPLRPYEASFPKRSAPVRVVIRQPVIFNGSRSITR